MAIKIEIDEKKLAQQIMNSIEKQCRNQLLYADSVLNNEFEKLYEQIIDQYYTYETQYYYRHDVGKGTGNGVNLYRASNMHMAIGSGKFNDNFIFGLDDNQLDTKRYKTTAEQVLENVMYGWRREVNGINTFIASVEFCGMYFSGTPYEIIKQIQDTEIVEKYRYKLFMEAIGG